MKSGLLVRVTKMVRRQDTEADDPERGYTVAVGHVAVGFLETDIQVGKPILMLRIMRNGLILSRPILHLSGGSNFWKPRDYGKLCLSDRRPGKTGG